MAVKKPTTLNRKTSTVAPTAFEPSLQMLRVTALDAAVKVRGESGDADSVLTAAKKFVSFLTA